MPESVDETYISKTSETRPRTMLQSPKNRICPSLIKRICWKTDRHLPGDTNGRRPSMTSTIASACQKVSPLTSRPPEAIGAEALAARRCCRLLSRPSRAWL
jgi:hypothetical protein